MKTPTLNPNRGRETAEHRQLKAEVRDLLFRPGEPVLWEHQRADIVGLKNGPSRRLCLVVEIERSPQHVLDNLYRDFAHGADYVLVVCPDRGALQKVRRVVNDGLVSSLHPQTRAVSIQTLRRFHKFFGPRGPKSDHPSV